jgi:myo-inositol 2-dehydrogenase / D-chiro-inositol 1-dehydrogenase
VQVAIFGAGRIGSLHAATLANHPDVSRLLIADIARSPATALAAQLNATPASIEEAFREQLDAVVIASPTSTHAQLIQRCLDRGIPVFCEKPLALDWEPTLRLVELVEASDAVLQVGFQRRFDPAYREAKRLIEEGTLGQLHTIRMAAHDTHPPHEDYIPTSGGIYRDLHIHDFDILRWLTGKEVELVIALGSVQHDEMFRKYGDVDTTATLLQMSDGVLVALTGGRRSPRGYDIRVELLGDRDTLAVGVDAHTPLRYVAPELSSFYPRGFQGFRDRFQDAYAAEISAFLGLCQGSSSNVCPARDALEALRIALAADMSLREHRSVRIGEVG